MKKTQLENFGREVIEQEAQALHEMASRLDDSFARACELMLTCQGRVIVIGMGKSGHIGNKIAATFASTGTPAFFVHPAEASHGDMGMITAQDVVLAISNSGQTAEILLLLPLIKHLDVPLISMTGNPNSSLAEAATVHIDVSVEKEACPLGLAPTTSTTVALAVGDAFAVALLDTRGFTSNDFALHHPGGSLGKRLLLKINDVMRKHKEIPQVSESALLSDALLEITEKKLGMTTITDKHNQLIGIFTDGDLRRTLNDGINIHTTLIKDVMSTHCKTIEGDILAAEALQQMEQFKITTLVVTDSQNRVQGILHLHDILSAGI